MSNAIETELASSIIESFRASSIKDRANFWHIFGGRSFPALSAPMAEAVRLAAAVELTANRMTDGVAFLDENPGLAQAGLDRLCAQEARQGLYDRALRLKPPTNGQTASDEHHFARLLAALAWHDFTGAGDIIGKLDRNVLAHPMADVLCAYTFERIERTGEGRNRLIDGVQKLRLSSFGAANADFWRAAALVGGKDSEFLARLGELFADTRAGFDIETAASIALGLATLSHEVGSPTPNASRALRTSIAALLRRPDARDYLSVQKWIRGVDLIVAALELEVRAEAEAAAEDADLAEIDGDDADSDEPPPEKPRAAKLKSEKARLADLESDKTRRVEPDSGKARRPAEDLEAKRREGPDPETARLAGRMQIQQGRLLFAAGQEKRGASRVQEGHDLLDAKRSIQVVQIARPIDIPSIPSVRRFEVGALRPVSLSPISRVDADPLRPTSGLNAQWAAEIDSASVLTGERTGSVFWYVTTRDGWMLADGLNVHPRLHFGSDRERLSSLSPASRVLLDAPGEAAATARLHGRSILLGGVPNYYHWLMEYLPKIGTLEGLMPGVLESKASWLINDNVAPWQIECLSLLGVEPDQLHPIRSSVTTRCDSLVVPSMMSAADATAFLRRRLDIERDLTDKRMIYISRLDADAPRRRIHQEELLAIALQQAGFEILIPSEMSFQDQIDAFASASVIVGPHGAGMTNLVFAQKDAVVIEIVNTYNQSYRFFSDIAEAVGVRYARFLSGSERANFVEPENANSVVDPQKLLAFIERLGAA